jgi:putative membrane-bound dehydrogenase-like protein
MKRLFAIASLAMLGLSVHAAEPLRVFIRAGASNRGKEVHAHPRFLEEWKPLLTERGMKVDGALDWPTAEQLKNTDVVLLYAQEGGDATPEQEAAVNEYLKRGGGIVVLHTAAVSMKNPGWWREVLGGAWKPGTTKWKEGPMDLYYSENQRIGGGHPITLGASNFHLDDEIYYDMDVKPEARVLASSYTPKMRDGKSLTKDGKAHIYDIQPQMWTYENTWEGGTKPYRAFTSIPGHQFATFGLPQYRAVLMRGLSWAAKRENLDEYVKKDELDALTYPAGGPQRPADTLKNLEIHPDFKLTLVAAEPLITKPMNFDWAPDGSMWVAETPEYPNGRRGMRPDYRGKEWKDHGGIDPTPGEQDRKALDKISRLIDTDGDGVADKKEVFYEGLDLVTGLVFHKDGVIVTQAPDILFLRDTDGDGKCDKVEKLYTGLGTGDTHAVINNPRWGWDGWIYATHGYSAGRVKSGDGSKDFGGIGSGVVRFKPDGSAFEQYSSKGGNTWGLEITGDNRVMWTQPTSGELLMQTVLPEYALARGKIGKTPSYNVVEKSGKTFPAMSWEQMAYVQIDWVGSFTAAAGCVVYDGGSWPAEYNGDYFTTEPTINIIHHANLTPQGSSYTFSKEPGREETEFIRSKDMWWRPIEVRVGPDGAVYIGDFYNQAVIHNDTRGPDHNKVNAAVRPDRDHYFGRIWRLDHKDAKKIAVPNLAKASVEELAKALEHPNRVVRMTASRLLVERGGEGIAVIESIIGSPVSEARISALWTLYRMAKLESGIPLSLIEKDKDAGVRRNVAQIIELANERGGAGLTNSDKFNRRPLEKTSLYSSKLITDADPHVRLAGILAYGAGGMSGWDSKELVSAWPKFDDDFQRSAAVGAASRNPAAVITAALDSADATSLAPLVAALTANLTNPEDAAKLAIVLAGKPASADSLKASILTGLGKTVQGTPAMSQELGAALTKLLGGGASAAALPLAAKWDKAGALKGATEKLIGDLFAKLDAGTDNDRLAAAQSLLGLRSVNDKALPAVAKLLNDAKLASSSKAVVIAALSETGDAAVGPALTATFATLDATGQAAAFDALLKRSEWTNALLDSVKSKAVTLTNLGPANIARLRTHPDPAISKRAAAMLEELNPMAKLKNEAIAKLLPAVEGPGGDAAKGKAMFTTTCAICHSFDGQGKDIGPGLTGMGSHAPAELLTAIVDPNREVDPSFITWNFELKNGQFMSGVIARENAATVLIRSLAGEQEIKVSDIKARTNTGRSLMPEGFEGLGAEALRDVIAYMASVDSKGYRTLDLKDAYTASSALGLYDKAVPNPEMVQFKKTGTVVFGGVPFNLVAPEKSATGKNVVQLQGGPRGTFSSKDMPAKVEIKVGGFKANRIHFLGGVGGWAYPYGQDTTVAMKAIVAFADGTSETLEFKNGVEIADYIARNDVPGSKFAEGLTAGRAQVRWFSKQLKTTGAIDKITLESTNTVVAPTTFAITVQLADANAPLQSGAVEEAPAKAPKAAKVSGDDDANFKPQFSDVVPQPPATKPANGPRVLVVGGGSSHDFVKYFGGTDKETLKSVSGWVDFTQNLNGIPEILDRVDVLVLSANQPIASKTKKALIDYANRGGAIIAHHPGTWYAWNNFPQWNKEIVGGGTRGHDSLGAFPVKVANAAHPITKGVPAEFEITDELYNHVADAEGTPIEVLVTATSPKTGKTFPQIFVVKHPKAKIVGFTLGHDARAHDLPAYQTLLRNAVIWAAGK